MVKIKSFFRFIIFLICLVLALGLIFDGIWYLASLILPWFIELSTFWKVLTLCLGLGILYTALLFVIAIIMATIGKIPKNKKLGYYTVFGATLLYALAQIYNSWTLKESYSTMEIILTTIISIFILVISFAIIGSAQDSMNYYQNDEA